MAGCQLVHGGIQWWISMRNTNRRHIWYRIKIVFFRKPLTKPIRFRGLIMLQSLQVLGSSNLKDELDSLQRSTAVGVGEGQTWEFQLFQWWNLEICNLCHFNSGFREFGVWGGEKLGRTTSAHSRKRAHISANERTFKKWLFRFFLFTPKLCSFVKMGYLSDPTLLKHFKRCISWHS